jgi:spore coat polysaccharide biosynthesis protein SpsF
MNKLARIVEDIDSAFIIQARLTSTRLPGKILLPFTHDGRTILDIIIDKLKDFHNYRIVVATSDDKNNDSLVDYLIQKDILYFRGSENDVLCRFISAAEYFHIDKIVRICSDNPFIDVASINTLLQTVQECPADYISFNVDGTPSIKTHFGFWAEFVTTDALKRVSQLTDDALYHEHVTNYIYTHKNEFDIKWIDVDSSIANKSNIRLTIDTKNDFALAQEIWEKVGEQHSISDIISLVKDNEEYLYRMQQEINKNTK